GESRRQDEESKRVPPHRAEDTPASPPVPARADVPLRCPPEDETMIRAVRHALLACFVAAALVAARADDPPAKPRHENKVTPEAQAVMDAYQRRVYRVSEH